MEKEFGRAIKAAQEDRKIKVVIATNDIPNITHQQFENDTILPGESTLEEAWNFKQNKNLYDSV